MNARARAAVLRRWPYGRYWINGPARGIHADYLRRLHPYRPPMTLQLLMIDAARKLRASRYWVPLP